MATCSMVRREACHVGRTLLESIGTSLGFASSSLHLSRLLGTILLIEASSGFLYTAPTPRTFIFDVYC